MTRSGVERGEHQRPHVILGWRGSKEGHSTKDGKEQNGSGAGYKVHNSFLLHVKGNEMILSPAPKGFNSF